MALPKNLAATRSIPLSEDEIAVVESYRALNLELAEALRRLATPLSPPVLPCGQELQANMPATPESLAVTRGEEEPGGP